MRVLQVHTHYREAGGEDAVVAAEADLLGSAGHEVVRYRAANPSTRGRTAAALAQAPANVGAARRLRAELARVRPDVAHVHNTWFALSPAAVDVLSDAGVPVVVTLHNYRLLCSNSLLFRDGRPCQDCVGSHPWHGVIHRCYRGSAVASAAAAATIATRRRTWRSDVDLFLVLNGFARDRFVSGGLSPNRMRLTSNFVNDPGPRQEPPSASATVLYVGRLSPEKGLHLLLDAVAAASQQLELLVIGDGPQRDELERRHVPNVRFVGSQPAASVRAAMLSSRALVMASECYEMQPMVVIEAAAAGLAVLASDHGGLPDMIGVAGPRWLVPPGDVDAWTTGLRGLAEGAAVDAAGAAMRRIYEQRFTPQSALQRLEAAYRDAIANRRAR